MIKFSKRQRKGQSTTPVEQRVIDKIARALEPDAWAEFHAGKSVCTNMAGMACVSSIRQAQRLIRAFPGICPIIFSAK